MTHSFKKINFIGSDKQDIILYLANLVNKLDLRCLVIDSTLAQHMKYILPIDKEGEMLTYGGIDYLSGIVEKGQYESLQLNMYDVVIVDYGFNQKLIHTIQNHEQIFIVTDFQRYHIEPLKVILQSLSKKIQLIKVYKDVVHGKISPKYIDYQLKLGKEKHTIANYIFELDEKGYRHLINCQYDGAVNLRYMNKEQQQFFIDLMEELFNVKVKSIKKLMRNGMRRKNDASSLLEYSSWAVGNYN